MGKTFIVSLGGSLVSPEAGKVDIAFLKKFLTLILKYVKRGNRFAIIVGGGKLARVWQTAAKQLKVRNSVDLDWIGIRATQLNSELVRSVFGKLAYREVVLNPAQKVSKFKILVGAGYVPGHSTDYDSVVRAKTLGAKIVANLSDVQYVYDKDPDKYKNARPLKNITWSQFFKIIGTDKFKPGMNVPFDPTAAKFAARYGIRVVFMSGKDLNNFSNFLQGKTYRGTTIQ